MRYAKDIRTKQDVDAEDVRGFARQRAYSCPVCGARVHYRSSMGLSPDPGFAHNKHAAKPDCELYHPGIGNYLPSSGTRARLGAEDAPGEIGMCLEDGETWTPYLRLPEIADLGVARLRSLRSGSVQVDAGGTPCSLSLMELRPGIGSARLVVPPSATPYKVTPTGDWPPSIPLNGAVLTALMDHTRWYARRFGEVKMDWFVFPGGDRWPKDPAVPITSLKTSWKKIRERAGVTGRWHDSRHTLVTELAESGAGDETIMAIAGHVSRQMLSRYAHIRTEAKRGALEDVDRKRAAVRTQLLENRQKQAAAEAQAAIQIQ